jgi:hypothetical protein
MAKLFTLGCSLTYSSQWPENLAKKYNLELKKLAVPAGDNVTQCRRFIDLFLRDQVNNEDIILWQITYLDRMGFRLSPDHHFLEYTNGIKHHLHTFETNLFDSKKHLDYVPFNHEWYEVWYYLKNQTQTLQELLFTLIIANQKVANKCLIWFAQDNLFIDNHEKTFCSMLDKHDISHLDYDTESLMSWVYRNSYPLAKDGMHPTETIYQKYVETFLEEYVKKFVTSSKTLT